jgi:hypothetical protein
MSNEYSLSNDGALIIKKWHDLNKRTLMVIAAWTIEF